MRDSQRSKVYAAESFLKGVGKQYPSVEDVKARILQILDFAYIKDNFHSLERLRKNVVVRPGKGARKASYREWGVTFTMPIWARHEYVILHEMAHMLDSHRNEYKGTVQNSASHGWLFTLTLLDLVRTVMGVKAYNDLKASFKKHKVRYTRPRAKRAITDEQRQALRERVAKARATKVRWRYGFHIPGSNTYRIVGEAITEQEAADAAYRLWKDSEYVNLDSYTRIKSTELHIWVQQKSYTVAYPHIHINPALYGLGRAAAAAATR
jgi:putative metallohydrolase (TIGR04338 family)